MSERYPSENNMPGNDLPDDYPPGSYVPNFYSTVQLLPVKLPAQFDQSLGLQPPARWLGLYWEPQLNQMCYTDGETVSTGNAQSWQLFCTHPQIEPILATYQLGNDGGTVQDFLLLDRQSNRLYAGESDVVEDYLSNPASLDLLASLDAPLDNPWQQPQILFKEYIPQVLKHKRRLLFLGLPAIAIGFRLLHEVGDSIFDLLEFWDD